MQYRKQDISWINKFLAIGILCSFMLIGCNEVDNNELPYLGIPIVTKQGDTLPYKISEFEIIDQDGNNFSNDNVDDKVYIADFFFTSCPSICPKVKKEMLRIYEAFEEDPQVLLLSHTIDPKRDTPERLKTYSQNLEVNNDKWIFLTGSKDTMMDLAHAYMVSAMEDPEAPGGFDHSGKILLVDKDGHIRAFSDGTEPDETRPFINKIKSLLNSYETD